MKPLTKRKKLAEVYTVEGSNVRYRVVDGVVKLAMGKVPQGFYYSMLNDALDDATKRGL